MSAGGFLGDYFTAMQTWRLLTRAQRRALLFPWGEPHPRVVRRLSDLGLWDNDGVTRSGLAVALCHFISATPPKATT